MLPYGSLPANATDPLLKLGVNIAPTNFTLTAPSTSGQSTNYLIQATFQESDANPIVLPYYNAELPSQPYCGPANSAAAQNTLRTQCVELEMKSGVPATSGPSLLLLSTMAGLGLYCYHGILWSNFDYCSEHIDTSKGTLSVVETTAVTSRVRLRKPKCDRVRELHCSRGGDAVGG